MTHYTRQLLQGNAADCSATCVRIISEFFGQHVSYVEMRALCGVGREGANVSQIKRGAEKLGFQCLIKKKGVVALSRQETPSILHWDARHFVVLDRVRNGTFYINDPAVGRRKLTKEEFQKHYTGICVEITPGREMRTARTPLSLHVILDLLDTQTRRLYSIFGLAVLTGGILFLLEVFVAGIGNIFYDFILEYSLLLWMLPLVMGGIIVLAFRFAVKHTLNTQIDHKLEQITRRVKESYIGQMLEQPIEFFEGHQPGEIASRLEDIEDGLLAMRQLIKFLGNQLLVAPFSAITLWYIDPIFAIALIGPSIVLIGALLISSTHDSDLSLQAEDAKASYDSIQVRRTAGYERFYAAGLQKHLVLSSVSMMAHSENMRLREALRRIPEETLTASIDALGLPFATFVGCYSLIVGELTYGAFAFSIVIAMFLIAELKKTVSTVQAVSRARLKVGRLIDTFHTIKEGLPKSSTRDTDSDQTRRPLVQNGPTPVVGCDHITYSYVGAGKPIFSNVTFKIYNEIVCITGASGSGKTTLLEIIAGIRTPTSGCVYFNGEPISENAQAGYVSSNEAVENGTLLDILSVTPSVRKSDITDALRDVQLWGRLGFYVDSNSNIQVNQMGLSFGEVQRLYLAQAILYGTGIVIFDDAFAHLSLEQSKEIVQRLKERNITGIFTSQRPEIIALCDRVFTHGT